MDTRIFAISMGPATHLDHLAPLCSLLDIPLIVTEREHLELGRQFYPMVDLRYIPMHELTLEFIAKHCDAIIECGKFWAMELKPALKMLYNKDLHVIFSPHGYSDKEDFLNGPVEQDIRLAYRDQSGRDVEMGNLRLNFYREHKAHFDALASGFFETEKKTVLYAPTWETKATGTSFFEHIDEVIDAFSDEYNLLVKPHPLLEEKHPAHYHRILGKHDRKARFIENFPAIYPLLEKTDIYLGDYSSIGYDFLSFNRPMYFLKTGGKLDVCGQPFKGCLLNEQEALSETRADMYRHVFGNKNASRDLLKALKCNLL